MPTWWIQAACVLVEGETQAHAEAEYRLSVSQGHIPCDGGSLCDKFRLLAIENPYTYWQKLEEQTGSAWRDRIQRSAQS